MKPIIYVDVLLAVNLYLNYFLLLATAKILRIDRRPVRMILGAALGAAYSLFLFAPPAPAAVLLLCKLAMAATILLAAFPFSGVRPFLRAAACFFTVSFAFAGAMLAIWAFLSPQGMLVKNAVVYFSVSPMLLFSVTVLCYLALRAADRLTGSRRERGALCRLEICLAGECVSLDAKIDTGNSLREPFSGYPVVVAEREALGGVWRAAQRDESKLRVTPYRALGGEGLLPAFRPDQVTLFAGKNKLQTGCVYIASCEKKISETFQALVNPELLEQGKQSGKRGSIPWIGKGRPR